MNTSSGLALLQNNVKREYLLKEQFKSKYPVPKCIQSSLNRICSFILNYTKVCYLSFVDERILIQYIKYHKLKNFYIISFSQTIQDIRNFYLFLNNKKIKIKELDLSIQNYHLWLRL